MVWRPHKRAIATLLKAGWIARFERVSASFTRRATTLLPKRRVNTSGVRATSVRLELCESDALGFRFAHYLVVTLPDDTSKHEQVIADAQSMVRRDAVVYRGVTSAEVEEIVRSSTLVGTRRVLVDLPVEAD